jgi:hypothetical protein
MSRVTSILTLAIALVLGSCASVGAPPGEQIGEYTGHGEVYTLSKVQSNPEQYFKRTLLVEAKIKAVCQSKGCWMQIEDGGQPALVRWETGCGGKYAFPKDAIGERVRIQGSFYPKVIAKKDVEHMEEEAGTNLDIPAKGYELNASAVVLLDRKAEK